MFLSRTADAAAAARPFASVSSSSTTVNGNFNGHISSQPWGRWRQVQRPVRIRNATLNVGEVVEVIGERYSAGQLWLKVKPRDLTEIHPGFALATCFGPLQVNATDEEIDEHEEIDLERGRNVSLDVQQNGNENQIRTTRRLQGVVPSGGRLAVMPFQLGNAQISNPNPGLRVPQRVVLRPTRLGPEPMPVLGDHCPICLDNLHEEDAVVLVSLPGRRICTHTYHRVCAYDVLRASAFSAACPLCRRRFRSTRPFPEALAQAQASQTLAQAQASQNQSQSDQIPSHSDVQTQTVTSAQTTSSLQPSPTPNQTLPIQTTPPQTLQAQDGEEIHAQVVERQVVANNVRPLDYFRLIYGSFEAWFDHVTQSSNTLRRETLIQRVMEEMGADQLPARERCERREAINAVWRAVVTGGRISITRAEFTAPGGLAETLAQNLST